MIKRCRLGREMRLARQQGEWAVAISDRRMVMRAALAAILISTIGLSACGRKGPLEPPPSAKATEEPADSAAVQPPQ